MIESDYNKKKVEIAQTSAVSESTEASKETEKEEHAKAVDEAIQKELNPSSGKSSEVKGNTDYCIEDKISEAKEKATQVKQSEFGLTGKESSTTGAIAKDASLKEDVKPTSDKSNFSDLKKRIDSFASKVEAYGKNLDSIEKEFEKSVQKEDEAYKSISSGIAEVESRLKETREKTENINLSSEKLSTPSEENIKAYAKQAVKSSDADNSESDTVKMEDGQSYDLTATIENRRAKTSEDLEKAIDENGIIGDAWHSIKNTFNIGDSSEDVVKLQNREKELMNLYKNEPQKRAEAFEEMTGYKYNETNKEKFINGEIELKSEKALYEYKIGQEQAVENISDIGAGAAAIAAVGAAPFTGGLSIGAVALGAGVGAGTKVALKGLDAATGDGEYSLKEAGKDALIGGAAGAVAPVSATAGNAIKIGKGTLKGAKVVKLTKGPLAKGTKAVQYTASKSAEGAIEGATEGFTRSVVEGDSSGDVIKNTLKGAVTGAALNPVIGSTFDAIPSGATKLSSKIKGIGSIDDSVNDVSQSARKNSLNAEEKVLASASNGAEDFAEFTDEQLYEINKKTAQKLDEIRAKKRTNDQENLFDRDPAKTELTEIEKRHSYREALEKDPNLSTKMDELKEQFGKDYYRLKFERFEGNIVSPSGRKNLYDNVMSNIDNSKVTNARMESMKIALKNNDPLVANAFVDLDLDKETSTILENMHKLPPVFLENHRLQNGSFHGHYSRKDRVIQASSPETLRHEVGHFIDSIIGTKDNYFSNKELDDVIESLTINKGGFISRIKNKRALNKAENIIKQARAKYYDELGFVDGKSYNNDGYGPLSDIYDALSEGAFHDNKKLVGHGHAYYSYKPNKAIEIFAEYFQMRVQNNTETLNMLQYTHPELSKALASMYSKVACKLRDGEWYDFKY